MNESEIENELRTLRPVPASPDLIERVARELSASELAIVTAKKEPVALHRGAGILDRTRFSSFSWWRGPTWAAAGAFAMWLLLPRVMPPGGAGEATTSPGSASEFQPGTSSRELLTAADDGLLYGQDETPQRQLRFSSLERHTWTNPATGAVLQFEIPREDIVLMPVAMQ